LSRVLAVAANTFRETVRERVLYNLVFFAILMTLSGLLVRQLSIRQDVKIIKDIGLASIELFGTLIAIFIGVGLVSKEIERRSLFPLLAKPLSRSEFYTGKLLGLAFTLLVNTAVMTAGLLLTLWATGAGIDVHLLRAIYPIYLAFLLVVAVAMFFSTVTSSALAAVCTVGVVLGGRYSDVIRNMREVAPGMPSWLVELLYHAVPNFRNFDFKDRVVYGDPVPGDVLAWVTAYGLLYVALVLVAGLLVFRGRDFQ
jgi:ABC-type transport system involved in multi-copper enzyme maturation permease subunit